MSNTFLIFAFQTIYGHQHFSKVGVYKVDNFHILNSQFTPILIVLIVKLSNYLFSGKKSPQCIRSIAMDLIFFGRYIDSFLHGYYTTKISLFI